MLRNIPTGFVARSASSALALLALLAAPCAGTTEPWRDTLSWRGATASVSVKPLAGNLREYAFHQVDAEARPRDRIVTESDRGSHLRTESALFDGLYALALAEAGEDSVDEIQDSQFNDGRPIPCRCFQTGLKWPYVWTRDISYSVDLALAALDPERARASLFFKQSTLRPELVAAGLADARVVAQDTGSGGSWPISTDRVVWIHAASDVLDALGPGGVALQADVLRIATDTLAQDRRYAYDARAGLYRGETSFLDWREQSYPAWTIADTRFIAEGFSLSTNVLHYVALRDAARLARHIGVRDAVRFSAEAEALKAAINARFWVPGQGLYASYLSRDLAPAYAYDLLGVALAIVHGIADPVRARHMLGAYPVTLAGPPVIWPEQPGIAIYHNRALWQFVTAYAMRAATTAGDPVHATAYAESIVRGAAMSLSNYENHEFLTQSTTFSDGPLSGPVINSPRQLWSVAGYIGMVVQDLFGVRIGDSGSVTVVPSLPGALAHRIAAARRTIGLEHVEAGGRTLDIALQLPSAWSDTDLLEAAKVSVDGAPLPAGRSLPPGAHRVLVILRANAGHQVPLRVVDAASPLRPTDAERRLLFAPPTPALSAADAGKGQIAFLASGTESGNRWQLYRDGVEIAAAAATEPLAVPMDPALAHCYFATQSWPSAGHRSLPSREVCIADTPRIYEAGSSLSSPDGHVAEHTANATVFRDWGTLNERLEFTDAATSDGIQRMTLTYSNGYGPVNTGVTAAVKEVTASCPSEPEPQRGTIVMPHLGNAGVIDVSTAFEFRTKRGDSCRIVVADGINMSYLEHFALYTAARGGRSGPWNRAMVYRATVVPVARPPREPIRQNPVRPE